MKGHYFSWPRFAAMVVKEFIQMRRDRLTFAMMVGLPLIHIILFGFAINFDPKHLPTAVLSADNSIFARSFIRSLENSGYFQVLFKPRTKTEVEYLLASGDVQFVVTIPENFARKLVRGERSVLLVEADATDPIATANAIATFNTLSFTALDRDLNGSLEYLKGKNLPFELRIHRRYNPEGITAYNIVPGLTGVILTMTMVSDADDILLLPTIFAPIRLHVPLPRHAGMGSILRRTFPAHTLLAHRPGYSIEGQHAS
jgi:ABC-2 type transport system permease protein